MFPGLSRDFEQVVLPGGHTSDQNTNMPHPIGEELKDTVSYHDTRV